MPLKEIEKKKCYSKRIYKDEDVTRGTIKAQHQLGVGNRIVIFQTTG